MIKNKKKKIFRSGSSFRFSRKKSDNIRRSQSDGKITSPSTSSTAVTTSSGPNITPSSTTKPRAYSPSDFYFHTTAQGGINAPLTPLSEHYATNENLLSLFSTLYEKDQYSVAYAAGLKFVEVALLQIPKNGYFKSRKYRKQRTKSAADALRVTQMLGGMLDEMEEDEETNHNDGNSISGIEKIEKLQKLATLAQRSFDDAIDDELNGNDNDGGTTSLCQEWDVAQQVSRFWNEWGKSGGIDDVMTMPDTCCTILGNYVRGEDEAVIYEKNNAHTNVGRRSLDSDFKQEKLHHCEKATETRDESKLDSREYQLDGSRSDELDEELKVALSMSLAESVNPTIPTSGIDGTKRGKKSDKLPVAVVAKQYREKYEWLRENGSIQVRFLDTYQGRIAESTNGCTVVAPLMCINYFTSERTGIANGISDDLINQVIDVHTVSVLPEVRRKLGLPQDSFIVPSDVHDHLIDTGLLSTSQFVGVCGGSILDDGHIEQFKSTLLLLNDERERERLRGKRIGATFFFAGHVIAFHLISHEDCNHIELIDSLPNHETWKLHPASPDVSCCEHRDPSETSSRYSDDELNEIWERSERLDYEQNRNAVRVRCLDVSHIDTLIRHYALAKFSDEEKRFCDEHEWQEANSSFDPRVFQAFIWAEA